MSIVKDVLQWPAQVMINHLDYLLADPDEENRDTLLRIVAVKSTHILVQRITGKKWHRDYWWASLWYLAKLEIERTKDSLAILCSLFN